MKQSLDWFARAQEKLGRSWPATLIGCLLAGFALYLYPVEGEGQSLSEEALCRSMTGEVATISQRFESTKFNLSEINPPAGGEGGFEADRAYEILRRTEKETLRALSTDARLVPLAAYAEDRFKAASASLQRISNPFCPSCVAKASYLDAVNIVRELLASIGKLKTLTVNLTTRSLPVGARLKLFVRNREQPERETTTNDDLENVYRGKYRVMASRSGYKDGATTINLMDEGARVLECKLELVGATADSGCVLK